MLNYILFKIFSIIGYNFFLTFLTIMYFVIKNMFVFRSNPFCTKPSKLIETLNIDQILISSIRYRVINYVAITFAHHCGMELQISL